MLLFLHLSLENSCPRRLVEASSFQDMCRIDPIVATTAHYCSQRSEYVLGVRKSRAAYHAPSNPHQTDIHRQVSFQCQHRLPSQFKHEDIRWNKWHCKLPVRLLWKPFCRPRRGLKGGFLRRLPTKYVSRNGDIRTGFEPLKGLGVRFPMFVLNWSGLPKSRGCSSNSKSWNKRLVLDR